MSQSSKTAICAHPDCGYTGTRPLGSDCPRCGREMTVVVSVA